MFLGTTKYSKQARSERGAKDTIPTQHRGDYFSRRRRPFGTVGPALPERHKAAEPDDSNSKHVPAPRPTRRKISGDELSHGALSSRIFARLLVSIVHDRSRP